MKLIVGLGNPSEKYVDTRHNIGFRAIDAVAKKRGISFNFEKKFEAEIVENDNIKLAKPQTFMNESGRAVRKMKDFYKIDNQNIIVVHDDVDLEEGIVKINLGGSSAGHKGIQSIIDHIGTEQFWRIRIGIGRDEKIPTEDWVLKNFEDKEKVVKIINKASEIIITALKNPEGLEFRTIKLK